MTMKINTKPTNIWWPEQLEQIAKTEGWEFGLFTPKQLSSRLNTEVLDDPSNALRIVKGDKLMALIDPETEAVVTTLIKRSKLKEGRYLKQELIKLLLTLKEHFLYEETEGDLDSTEDTGKDSS